MWKQNEDRSYKHIAATRRSVGAKFLWLAGTLPLAFVLLSGLPIFEKPKAQVTARTVNRRTTFDVRAFGAKGDGKILDTRAINKAIDAATVAGGGTVHF